MSTGSGVPAPQFSAAPQLSPTIARSHPAVPELRLHYLRFEAAVFVLLLATFAAVLFESTIIERRLSIGPDLAAQYPHYTYSDLTSGGRSTASDGRRPLRWSCEIRTGFAYPFCGYGLMLDKQQDGRGSDLSRFANVRLVLDYRGPSDTLKLALKNRRTASGRSVAGEDAQPNAIEFKVRQGRQTIELHLADAAVEPWWVAAHQANDASAAIPAIDNVVAVDLQTGAGAKPGVHDFAIETIEFDGSLVSTEQFYLLILGFWTTLAAFLIAHRLLGLKRHLLRKQEQHRAETQMMEAARAAAESASQAKSRFLASMSHELRTPLNAILGYAQILQAAALDERHNGAARTIRESGEHLLTLIGDILDVSKIEAGKVEIVAAAFDVGAMVRGVAEMMVLRAEEKRLRFVWSIGPDVPARIEGDEKHLRQVLINLVGNAVKFTECGEVALSLGLIERAGGNVRLRFEVRDTGRGIAGEEISRIFMAFEQGGTAGTRAHGTGLGLSISQQLIELMGSQIEVESRFGEGSRFWFDLDVPLAGSGKLLPGLAAHALPTVGATAVPDPALGQRRVPPLHLLEAFRNPARAGNMRAICAEAERLSRDAPAYADFGEHLTSLARGYQSAAVLELIERPFKESLDA